MSPVITRNHKLETKVRDLREEVDFLRSAIVGILGKDQEGRYRPSFVKSILSAARERPTQSFTKPESFLRQLRKV